MKEIDVITVGMEQTMMQPLLVLREVAGQRRVLPIRISAAEASAIEIGRHHDQALRPLGQIALPECGTQVI